MLTQKLDTAHNLIFRIIVRNSLSQTPSCGTGFVFKITKDKVYILTCLHVLLANTTLAEERISKDFGAINRAGYEKFIKQYVTDLKVEWSNKAGHLNTSLEDFLIERDLAVLSIPNNQKYDFGTINLENNNMILGTKVFFCGFPITPNYSNPTDYPFTVNEGIVSANVNSAPNGKYTFDHYQINAVSLGGNSGAALFVEDSLNICGIVDGNMQNNVNLGIKRAAIYDSNNNLKMEDLNFNFAVPFGGIGYAIPLSDNAVKDFLNKF